MNILYVTTEVPYPLTSGYLRHFHFLHALSGRHTITLLSLTRRPRVCPGTDAALAPLVPRFEVFGARGRARGGRLHRLLRTRRAARELSRAVARHLAADTPDVVLLSGKDTFPALRAIQRTPLVVDICDAASVRLRGELAVTPRRARPVRALRLAETRRIERRLVARTRHLLFASERDRAALGAEHGVVVPNGVDLEFWRRRSPPAGGAEIAFTGVMAYRPNHDAAMRLVARLLPLVRERLPAASVVLAGRDPRPALRTAAAGRAGVTVTGACSDLRPHLAAAAVYCAPLRFASGVQNKLLEALAMELPVVTTDVAAAGLRVAAEDPPLVVADDDEDLAAAIAGLLADPAARARLGAAGRRYVERHFAWPRAAALLESVLCSAVGACAAPGSPDPLRPPPSAAVALQR
jgi:glycosyltransferase involved in cell wall biosynthesis